MKHLKSLGIPEFISAVLRAADRPFAIGRIMAAINLSAELVAVCVWKIAKQFSSRSVPEDDLADVARAAEKLRAVRRNIAKFHSLRMAFEHLLWLAGVR